MTFEQFVYVLEVYPEKVTHEEALEPSTHYLSQIGDDDRHYLKSAYNIILGLVKQGPRDAS